MRRDAGSGPTAKIRRLEDIGCSQDLLLEGPVLGDSEVSGQSIFYFTSSRILGNALGKAMFQHTV